MAAARKLVIIGDRAFAEIAHEYFSNDSAYEVVGFAVERDYLCCKNLLGLPVVAVEEMERFYSPDEHDVFVAIVYSQLNRLRTRLLAAAEAKGYSSASYVSSRAWVSPSARLGRHCFVFEDNVVQPFVSISDNVVLWSGNHIGHHSKVGANCFISSHVVISGYCSIGENCFIGVNATIANDVSIARDTWVGPGIVLQSDSAEGDVYRLPKPQPSKTHAHRLFKIER